MQQTCTTVWLLHCIEQKMLKLIHNFWGSIFKFVGPDKISQILLLNSYKNLWDKKKNLHHPTSSSFLVNMALIGDGLVAALSSCWKRLKWPPSSESPVRDMICLRFSCWLKRTWAAFRRPSLICCCLSSGTSNDEPGNEVKRWALVTVDEEKREIIGFLGIRRATDILSIDIETCISVS